MTDEKPLTGLQFNLLVNLADVIAEVAENHRLMRQFADDPFARHSKSLVILGAQNDQLARITEALCSVLRGAALETEQPMDQRAAFDETVELAAKRGMPSLPGTSMGLEHIFDMQARLAPEFSEAKVGRWLGWAQAALVFANVGVSLEDVKALNQRFSGEAVCSD